MQCKLIGLIVALVGMAPRATLAQSRAPVLAVFQVEDQTKKLAPSAVQQLTSYLSVRFAAGGAFRGIPSGQLKERLVQQKRDSFKACYDQKCQIEVGRELAADKSVSTQIIQLGSRCAVLSSLYDLKQATTERSASEKSGCAQDDLVAALEKVVDALKAQAAPPAPTVARSGSLPGSVRTGGLFLKSKPLAASVWLDGTKMAGTTPVTLPDIPEGEHFIELRQGDYRVAGKVRVAADRFTNLSFDLKKVRGKLEVLSTPPEAQIYLDGRWVGTTPKVLDDVEAGQHSLDLRKPGFMTVRGTVRLGADTGRRTVNLTLVQAAVLAVRSEPFGAAVFVDGKRTGETPAEIKVSPGSHSLKLALADRKPATRQVSAQAGKLAVISIKLELSEEARARREAADALKRREWHAVQARIKADAEAELMRNRQAAADATTRQQQAAKPASTDTPDYPSMTRRRSKTILAYTSLGTSVACLAVGGALYGLGLSQRSSAYDSYRAANSPDSQTLMDQHWSDVDGAQTKITVGHVFLGLGVAALGFSFYEFITRPSGKRSASSGDQVSFSVSPAGRGATMVLSGRYW